MGGMYDRVICYFPLPIANDSYLIGKEFQTQSLGGCGESYLIQRDGTFEWQYYTDPHGENNRIIWINLPFDGEIIFYTQLPVDGSWKADWFEFKASFRGGKLQLIEPSTVLFEWEFAR
jgi:hypothetical protein